MSDANTTSTWSSGKPLQDPAEESDHLDVATACAEELQRPVAPGRSGAARRQQATQPPGIGRRVNVDAHDGRSQHAGPGWNRNVGHDRGMGLNPLARQRVEEPADEGRPQRVRQLGDEVRGPNRAPARMSHGLLEHQRHVGDAARVGVPLVGGQQRRQFGLFAGRLAEGPRREVTGAQRQEATGRGRGFSRPLPVAGPIGGDENRRGRGARGSRACWPPGTRRHSPARSRTAPTGPSLCRKRALCPCHCRGVRDA